MACCCLTTCLFWAPWILYAAYLIGFYGWRHLLSAKNRFTKDEMKQKVVMITGCDTGFGYMTSKRLDAAGIKVLAGCLTDAGAATLNKENPKITTFKLDVTNDDSVEQAFEVCKKAAPDGIWAIINNAGVLRGGLLEVMSMDDWMLQFQVNTFGMARVCKRFTTLLRPTKGRFINICSVAGRFAMAGTSAYSGSKYAAEALSDALRRELKIWGIKVIIIEPGIMKTPLWAQTQAKDSVDRVWNNLPQYQKDLYGREYFEQGFQEANKIIDKMRGDPEQVVDVLEQAVTTKYPMTRYNVGMDSTFWLFLSYIPAWLADAIMVKNKPVPAALKK